MVSAQRYVPNPCYLLQEYDTYVELPGHRNSLKLTHDFDKANMRDYDALMVSAFMQHCDEPSRINAMLNN